MLLTDQFEEAALLHVAGFHPSDVRFDPARSRVVFVYADDSEAEKILVNHRNGRETVCSAAFVEGIKWAKRRIYQVRDVSPEARGSGLSSRRDLARAGSARRGEERK